MEEKEIDLRDYIEIVLKRKWIIITVFLVAVITTAIVSLRMPKVYQATASIMILPSKIQTALSPTQVSLDVERKTRTGEYLGPTISLPTHKTLLKSNPVLERVINRLKLRDKSGKSLIPDNLSKRLDVKDVKETSILQLEAEGNNPRIAKKIANTWVEEYVQYSQELIFGEVKGTGDFISNQFKIAKQNLTQTEEKVKDFKNKYKIDLMRAELNIRKKKLNKEKGELINLEIVLRTKKDSLKELKKEIEKQEKFTIVSKAITDDILLWREEGKGKRLSDLEKRKLRSEKINPIYQNLEARIVNTKIELNTLRPKFVYLKKSIESTKKEVDELERTINQKEFDLTQLTRQVEIYKRTYNNLSTKIEEARIAKATQLGEVKIISPATEPEYPIKPKKKQMVAISGILSLMMGIFLAFFLEYWSSPKRVKE